MLKTTLTAVLLFFSALLFSGCYDAQEIDSDSYVIAIGADTAESGYVFTFQFSNPLGIYSTGGEEESPTASTVTLCAENFQTAKSLLGSFIGKNVSLSQTKVIIFSYDTAREGTADLVKSFLSEREIRQNAYTLVSAGTAEEFLNSVDPILSISAAKYYENLFRDEALKFAPLTNLKTLGETLENSWIDCVIPFAGLAEEDSSLSAPANVGFAAGEQPRKGGETTEVIGMAVMKNGVLVGEMTGYSSALYKILDETAKNLPLTFGGITFQITEKPCVKKHITVQNGVPKISVEVTVTADNENARQTEEALSNALSELLYESSRSYNADILGFGSDYRRKYPTDASWDNVKWSEIYKDSEFYVTVKIKT